MKAEERQLKVASKQPAQMTPQETRDEFHRRFAEMDQTEPVVVIHLGRNDYKLEYTNRAVKGILADTKVNILSDVAKLDEPEIISQFLYHGLVKHHKDLTIEGIDEMWGPRHLLYVTDRIRLALEAFMPDLEGLVARPSLVKTDNGVVGDPLGQQPAPGSDTGQPGEDSDFLNPNSGDQP